MKVVCASGYFNPLHIGHLNYLRAARCLGDYLIVIVNNDLQVRLKGSVPFMREAERLDVIASLRCVNEAILAVDGDRSVSRTLTMLHPQVFANGGDVLAVTDSEASVCQRLGIEMVFGIGGKEKIQSSSLLLSRARDR